MLIGVAIARAQSRAVECASLTKPAVAASTIPTAGTADRDGAPGLAPQIQTRRTAAPRSTATCRCGTVDAAALTAKSNSQEVLVLAALPGSFRFDHVLLRESTQFASNPPGTVTVAMGRAGTGNDVVWQFGLRNPTADSFWHERPGPPQLTGAYDLVLFFQASFPLGDGAASNLRSGIVTWEVCGFTAPPATAR